MTEPKDFVTLDLFGETAIVLRPEVVSQPAVIETTSVDSQGWRRVSLWGATVRVWGLDDGVDTRFIAKDVCEAVGYNPKNVSQFVPADERGSMKVLTLGNRLTGAGGGPQSMLTVNRAGFYRILLDGRTPEARAVKTRIVTDVMPALQEHGCYPPPLATALPSGRAIVMPQPEERRIVRFEETVVEELAEVRAEQKRQAEEQARMAAEQERQAKAFASLAAQIVPPIDKTADSVAEIMVKVDQIVPRNGFGPDSEETYFRVVVADYGNKCPCCELVNIVAGGKWIPNGSETDHAIGRNLNATDQGWRVCASKDAGERKERCHYKLTYDAAFREQHDFAWKAFRRRVQRTQLPLLRGVG